MRATGAARVLGFVLLACSWASGARAEDAPKTAEPGKGPTAPAATAQKIQDEEATINPPTRWYGWQILLCDAATATQLAIAAAVDTSGVLYVSGGSTYFACPMFLHFLHNQVMNIGFSAGARILLPTAGAGIGHLVAPKDGHSRDEYLGIGALIGATAAAAIDIILVSREEIPLWERPENARGRPSIVPVVGLGTVGVAGRF